MEEEWGCWGVGVYDYADGVLGVEEGEGFVADGFAGEEEGWLGDAGLLADVDDAVGLVDGVFVDDEVKFWGEFHER